MQLPRLLVRLIDPISGKYGATRRVGGPKFRAGAVYGLDVPGGARQATAEELAQARWQQMGHAQKQAEALALVQTRHAAELLHIVSELIDHGEASGTVADATVEARIERFWHGDHLLHISCSDGQGRRRSSGRTRIRPAQARNRELLLHYLANAVSGIAAE